MCAINGILKRKKDESLRYRIKNMNNSLAHRGPDDEGCWLSENHNCVFGHRRLSIIDLDSRSRQPMLSNSGKWMIVFNGEIYNYKTLKKRTSYSYRTMSDTEVILAYTEEFGVDSFLQDANGMFSIVLYRTDTGDLFLIRDRMGIKPLYYYRDKDSFVFSSEIKGILNSGLAMTAFNYNAVDEYLGNRYVRAPYTFFQNIYQVLPGEILTVSSEFNIKKAKYWNLPIEFSFDDKYDEAKILNEFHEKLKCSISMRMISDVPVGTYLSGGVDSSLITAFASGMADDKLNTYTIGFDELNEFKYAGIVAAQYQTYHHALLMDKNEYISMMDMVIGFKDAPLGVPNEILLAKLSLELKKKISVVLSGEGADELLGGYGRIFRSAFDYRNLNIKGAFYDYFIAKYEYVSRKLRDQYLSFEDKPLRREFDEKVRTELFADCNEENIFRFFHSYHVQGLLQRVDTTTMLAGVEARVPFLDHTLIEYTYGYVPYTMKLRWKDGTNINNVHTDSSVYSEADDIPKYLLKRIAEKYLPDDIIYRKKMGFPVPLNQWFSLFSDITTDLLYTAPWLNNDKVDELINTCKADNRAGQILWMFLNVEMFRRKYFEKDWRY